MRVPGSEGLEGYDFEILHLNQDVELNEKVQLACLPTKQDGLDDSFLDGKKVFTSCSKNIFRMVKHLFSTP